MEGGREGEIRERCRVVVLSVGRISERTTQTDGFLERWRMSARRGFEFHLGKTVESPGVSDPGRVGPRYWAHAVQFDHLLPWVGLGLGLGLGDSIKAH